jgi:chromosome segregation ATPase
MPSKTELTQALGELEEEYRFWVVEAIALERGIENLEDKVDQYENEIGAERTAEFRARLNRTRERHSEIETRIRFVRQKLDEMKTRLRAMPE